MFFKYFLIIQLNIFIKKTKKSIKNLMGFYFNVMLFILFFQKIKPFLIISMTKKNIDDCIRKIELDDGTNLFEKNTSECAVSEKYVYNEPLIEQIPYELGQKIKIVIGDGNNAGICGFLMDIYVNNNAIKNNDLKFWDCDNCINYYYNHTNNMINCYPPFTVKGPNNYSFYFSINSLKQLDFNTSEYLSYMIK